MSRSGSHGSGITGADDERSVWKIHGTRRIYDDQWIQLDLADIELPDGHRFDHHVVRLRPAAIAVMLDNDNRILMLWRHRFVAGRWGWELPGGLVDDGEEPIQAVAREIEEETGYRAGDIHPILTFEPMAGMVDSPHHLFLARDMERIGEPTETTEFARMEWVPLAAIPSLVAGGDIWSSGTLIAVTQVLVQRLR